MISTKNKTNMEEDGFIILRNILTASEVKSLRETVDNHFSKYGLQMFGGISQPNAAVLIPELDWIFSHPNIINYLKKLLPDQQIMFTNHCDVHSGILAGWHKDDGTSSDQNNLGYFGSLTYGIEDCKVYKVAIYLQDHVYNLAGLKVKQGSHKIASTSVGEEIYLKTRVGDIIIFDVRLTHSGQSDILPIPWLGKPLSLTHKLFGSSFNLKIKSAYEFFLGTKMSIFFTFGASNDWTVKFAKSNMKRQLNQNLSSKVLLPSNTSEKLLAQDILLAESYFTDL